ncbi:hypothetical protein NFX31_06010 [Microbacterium azadirachtae]|uniref:hypothetical protein n=1 Tax=Microbacterium azadirachtae TaxID=582680 RepID=UPI0021D4FFF9|nr:hypothetical protein [Microbacterium azadirachtae]UXW87076.1 hypothetical protein NFX31_06010 [Microbacterium azadirachtae]
MSKLRRRALPDYLQNLSDQLAVAARSINEMSSSEREAAVDASGAGADEPLTERGFMEADVSPDVDSGHGGARSSLVRWEGNEDLRDAIVSYARRERYSIHAVLLASLRRGLDEIRLRSAEHPGSAPLSGDGAGTRMLWSRESKGHKVVIELNARAFRDSDGSWTIQIPQLTSMTPRGTTIVATGSAPNRRAIEKAATELASAWIGVEMSEVVVNVTVEDPQRWLGR